MTDDEVIERLVRIRGVGTWTAKIFLMFALGRRACLYVWRAADMPRGG